VTGGIDPTYLALTPGPTGPQGFINPLWLDNSANLRSKNIKLENATDALTLSATDIGRTGATAFNITSYDEMFITSTVGIVHLLAPANEIEITAQALMNISASQLDITSTNTYINLTSNNGMTLSTTNGDITLTTVSNNINLNALNVNSYNYAMPICFDLVETSTINYTLVGQQMEKVYIGTFNLPYQFFSDIPLIAYTSTKWKIDFQINCYNSSGGQGDKGFASYIDFEDQATNLYRPFLFNATTPFARFFNSSSYNQASPSLFSWGWSDFIDFAGLVGTGSGNLPLKVNLYVAADNVLTGDFKWKVSLTRTNGL